MATPNISKDDDESRRLWRLSGLGMELASVVVAGLLLGWLVDLAFKTGPAGLITGAILGIIVAMTNFIRSAVRLSRQSTQQYHRKHPDGLPPLEDQDDGDDDQD